MTLGWLIVIGNSVTKGFIGISFSNKQIDFVPLKSTCALGQYGFL